MEQPLRPQQLSVSPVIERRSISDRSMSSRSSSRSINSSQHTTDDECSDSSSYDIDTNGKGNNRGSVENFVRRHITVPCVLLFILSTSISFVTIHLSYSSKMKKSASIANNPIISQQVISLNTLRRSEHNYDPIEVLGTTEIEDQCRWYLAESAIPQSGLGLYTSRGLHKNDMVGFPDICIFVSDPPDHWTHLRSHSYGQGKFFGQFEGRDGRSRAVCEGFSITYNTVPDDMVNTELVSPALQTNGGLHRAVSPGAGASTHHFGIYGRAVDIITAGSELTINYNDWNFDKESSKKYKSKPSRPIEWLQKYGWCVDNIEIKRSTMEHAGRGAFARLPLKAGQVVAPAPLQVFQNRSVFETTFPEQLFVNYCLQPRNSDMVVFPYGPGVNLINHSYKRKPNVAWRWADHDNKFHRQQWLDLSYTEFWNIVAPGKLVLEVVALRDIMPGEELLIDYGDEWEAAWVDHIAGWEPVPDADKYVYPAEVDETKQLRTVTEQLKDPYPTNLITTCITPDWKRKSKLHITWYETDYMKLKWWRGVTFCHILYRDNSPTGDDAYTVQLIFDWQNTDKLEYNFTESLDDKYIDYKVPRRAIRFVEKPYLDDEHLPNAFRHPLVLPDQLTPRSWLNEQSTI